MLDVVSLTRKLVDIPSVTGQERQVGVFVRDLLRGQGWNCVDQEVTRDRFNVLAVRAKPTILLTTHMDTVPQFFPSREDEEFVYGRGACDAKGIAASMICAAQVLAEEGYEDVGLLFVVGEEIDSIGAIKARELDLECLFLINGEPTDNHLVTAHKGILHGRISVEGRAAHSAYPEQGESAIEKLIGILERLRETDFPSSSSLGSTHVNVGTIKGGSAPNVVATAAEAEILVRTVCESSRYVEVLRAAVGDDGRMEILKTSEPQAMEAVDGFPTKVVAYGTDIPVLRTLGKPLLLGPGSILEAHTAGEKISKRELADAVGLYHRLVVALRESSG